MGIFRTVKAELLKDFRQSFFSNYMIIINIILPLGLGLTYYFIYLPFPHEIVHVQGFDLSLVNFTLSGQMIYLLFINMLSIGGYFNRERFQGTLETIFLTPCNRVALLLGGSVAGLLNYCWFLLGVGCVFFILHIEVHITSLPAVFLSVGLIVLSTIIIGMLFQAFFIASRRGNILSNFLQEPVIFVSGIVFPLQYAPRFIRLAACAVPLTYSVLSLRASVFAGATVHELSHIFLLLFFVSVGYLLLTWYFIRLIDIKLRKEGTIQLF